MAKPMLAIVALGLLQAAGAPPAAGREVVICTANGPRTVRLDDAGQPVAPAPFDQATGCAHLWCEPRRPRLAARNRN